MSNVTVGTDTVAVSKGQTNGTTTTATLAGDSLLFTTVNNADNTIVNQFSIAAGGIFDLIIATFNKGIVSTKAENHFANGTYTDPTPNVGQAIKASGGIATDMFTVTNQGKFNSLELGYGILNPNPATQAGYFDLHSSGGGAANGLDYDARIIAWGGNKTSIGQATLEFAAAAVNVRGPGDSGYSPIAASAFNVNSQSEAKDNIQELAVSALDVINATKTYSYELKAEKAKEQGKDHAKKMGLLFEEAPAAIQGGVDTIDLYSMNTLLWKAVQELSVEVEALKAGK